MSPQFWVTQYIRKTNNLNNQITILICDQKKKKKKKTINRTNSQKVNNEQ